MQVAVFAVVSGYEMEVLFCHCNLVDSPRAPARILCVCLCQHVYLIAEVARQHFECDTTVCPRPSLACASIKSSEALYKLEASHLLMEAL